MFTLIEVLVISIIVCVVSYISGAVIEHHRMKRLQEESETTKRHNNTLKRHYTGKTWLSKPTYTGTEKRKS